MTDKFPRPSYLGTMIDGWLKRSLFRQVKYFCMFFGYPGSGHSLVGSLLDAHPNMVIAHELDALDLVQHGFHQGQLFAAIMQRSRRFTEQGHLWKEHKYTVEGQYQGSYDQELVVIGDKKGGWSSRRVENDPAILLRLLEIVKIPVKFIHVTRNPYDNISTMTRRSGRSLEESVEIYFQRVAGVQLAMDLTNPDDWTQLRHEDVIAEPGAALRTLCAVFGLSCSEEYIKACSALVFPNPNKTRENQPWTEGLKKVVADGIERYPFLQSYSFEN
jgi:hypothetical protein